MNTARAIRLLNDSVQRSVKAARAGKMNDVEISPDQAVVELLSILVKHFDEEDKDERRQGS